MQGTIKLQTGAPPFQPPCHELWRPSQILGSSSRSAVNSEPTPPGGSPHRFNSELYARHRPVYPKDLIHFVLGLGPRYRDGQPFRRILDLATGNGQVAQDLAVASPQAHVIAADRDLNQVKNHLPGTPPNLSYAAMDAARCALLASQIDLVTIATAAHWFDNYQATMSEVVRVSRPGAIVVIFGYYTQGLLIEPPSLKAMFEDFAFGTLGPYWTPGHEILRGGYEAFPFPFGEIESFPTFYIERAWSADEILKEMQTWSAYDKYEEATGRSPFADTDFPEAFRVAFGPERRLGRWPINGRIGRVEEIRF